MLARLLFRTLTPLALLGLMACSAPGSEDAAATTGGESAVEPTASSPGDTPEEPAMPEEPTGLQLPTNRLAVARSADGPYTVGAGSTIVTLDSVPGSESAMTADGLTRWRLVIDDIEVLQAGATFSVYLDPPHDTEPDPQDPSFLGTLSVFGTSETSARSSRSYDITDQLADREDFEDLRLLVVADGEEGGGDALRVGSVSIVPGSQ